MLMALDIRSSVNSLSGQGTLQTNLLIYSLLLVCVEQQKDNILLLVWLGL